MKNSNIVITHEISGSVEFIIECKSRKDATDRNIMLSVNEYFLNIFDKVESRMEKISGGYTRIVVDYNGGSFYFNWTFAKSIPLEVS